MAAIANPAPRPPIKFGILKPDPFSFLSSFLDPSASNFLISNNTEVCSFNKSLLDLEASFKSSDNATCISFVAVAFSSNKLPSFCSGPNNIFM